MELNEYREMITTLNTIHLHLLNGKHELAQARLKLMLAQFDLREAEQHHAQASLDAVEPIMY